MKQILIFATLSIALFAQAKEISLSGDSSVQDSTESLLKTANKLDIKDENGKIVAYKLGKIEKNSTLAKLGLKSGDIINMPNSKKMVLETKKVVLESEQQ